ncbi:MAG: triacylglycerol lipase [Corynebacteriales bacterium]|nr:triacylglycerol lipase [Mycobacteriales bacterium]
MVVGVAAVVGSGSAVAADSFYSYTGSRPLAQFEPGAVLKQRTVPFHLSGIPVPLQATQIVYRSTDALGKPVANVTSYLKPPNGKPRGVISYQSAYDSLNPADGPSRAVAGDFQILNLTPKGRNIAIGNTLPNGENQALLTALALGYAANIPDTEGQNADFAAGPEYGMLTLDSLRAISTVPTTQVSDTMKIGLLGYSGGAIASNWAAILAPGYAPEINKRLLGVAQGGVLVNPARVLSYASGSVGWGGVVGMAIVGIARGYGVDFGPYISSYGRQVIRQLSDASIGNAFYPGLTWQKLVKPEYANPNSVPELVDVANKINMGTAPVPTVPMLIVQGANGVLEGTRPGPPGVGRGDGVMVAGDVRALAQRYCDAGLRIQYRQYDLLSHIPAAVAWLPESILWLLDRFADRPAPSSCGHIAAGNPRGLSPQTHVAPAGR